MTSDHALRRLVNAGSELYEDALARKDYKAADFWSEIGYRCVTSAVGRREWRRLERFVRPDAATAEMRVRGRDERVIPKAD